MVSHPKRKSAFRMGHPFWEMSRRPEMKMQVIRLGRRGGLGMTTRVGENCFDCVRFGGLAFRHRRSLIPREI